MRVVAFFPTPRGMTGGPRRLLTLALSANNADLDVVIVTTPDSDLLSNAEELGVPSIGMETAGVLSQRRGALFRRGVRFRIRVAFDLFRNNWRVARIVRQQRADVVWIRSSKGFAFCGFGAWLTGRPLIWDVDGEPRTQGLAGLLLSIASIMSRVVVVQYSKAVDNIFSPRTSAAMLPKVHVLVPGIDMDRMEKLRERKSKSAGCGDYFRILQVGSICENKNQLFMLEVIEELKRDIGKVELCFVGGTLDDDYLERVHAKLSAMQCEVKVRFSGWRNDIGSLMVESDLLVMPSKDEGVPNAVQEGMAVGLPVIVSDAGGMPEIVLEDETGWVFSLDDPKVWANQIDICRQDLVLCQAVGAAAAKYAADRFGADKWAREYAEVIEQVKSGSDSG